MFSEDIQQPTTEIYHFAPSINTHCWNADKTRVALCPNNNEIHIYAKKDAQFSLEHVLTQHEALVTSIDWAHNSNQILSCSQDRNAYIWRFSRGSWKPALFLLRTTRGATRCKWSPKEDKFVVTTAEKLTCVCYDDNGFSISKHIKKHESTVLDAAWHPNNFILATVSSDSKCHIVSGFISYVDNKENIGTTSFGDRLPFGKHVKTYEARAWIHCVKWSTSGTQLAYASHDSTLTVVDVSTADHAVQAVRYNYLPLLDLLWINEHSLVGVGYDGVPLLFQKHGAEWTFVASLDNRLQHSSDDVMLATECDDPTQFRRVTSKHQNSITCIQAVSGTSESVTAFSTTGLDGALVIWHVKKALETQRIKF